MLIKINGLPIIDEQEKLFEEVKESFVRLIAEYRRKHWFKEFIYDLNGGEDLINMDWIKAKLWYWKLVIVLKSLRFFIRISPPDEKTADRLIEVLEQLKAKLEVD